LNGAAHCFDLGFQRRPLPNGRGIAGEDWKHSYFIDPPRSERLIPCSLNGNSLELWRPHGFACLSSPP
jgi:hypothetical protein